MNYNTNFKQIKLIFPDMLHLWSFSHNLANQNLEINTATRLLICEGTDADLARAITHYGACPIEESTDQYNLTRIK